MYRPSISYRSSIGNIEIAANLVYVRRRLGIDREEKPRTGDFSPSNDARKFTAVADVLLREFRAAAMLYFNTGTTWYVNVLSSYPYNKYMYKIAAAARRRLLSYIFEPLPCY